MVGNIYLSKIYFTDLSEYKIRPVLVLKEIADDCICVPLTTITHQNGIIISSNDLERGELKKESLIIIPKNFTLHKSILFKYLATLKTDKLNTIFATFCQELGCQRG
jgi:mRNA interferase MazF